MLLPLLPLGGESPFWKSNCPQTVEAAQGLKALYVLWFYAFHEVDFILFPIILQSL